jgi:glycosyltransferase involved in cell wall biosynthesis
MHICFITNEYPKEGFPHGGVGTFIKTIAIELVKKNISVSVIGFNYNNQIENYIEDGVHLYRLKPNQIKGINWFLNSIKIQKTIEKLHAHNPISIIETTEMGLAFLSKIDSIKYVIRLNGGHHFFSDSENRGINWWKGFQEKRSFKKADKIIGVSKYVLEHTSKYIKFENKKAGVIFNPANLERFYEANNSKIEAGRIFFAGTICEKKGIRQLIQAMPLIVKKFPNAHLVIAGREWYYPNTNKSYTDYLKTFIDDSVRDVIQFLGNVENTQIPIQIEKSEICCYPSHMEAMPLAWVEVMSMGKSFVASNLGPGKEVVEDGVMGLLCNPLAPEDIASKIMQLLHDPELAKTLGKNARKAAIEKFDKSVIVLQNIDFYQSILK